MLTIKRPGKYDDLKKAAAEARHRTHKNDVVNYRGLASIRPVKITSPAEEAKRKKNKEKYNAIIKWVTEVNAGRQEHSSDWNTLADWRMVTEKTVHKYIPKEYPAIGSGQIHNGTVSKIKRPRNKKTEIGEDTSLWYLSRNQLRKVIYRASISRAQFLTN